MKRFAIVLMLALVALIASGQEVTFRAGEPNTKTHCWHGRIGMGHESARWLTETCCWCGVPRNVVYSQERDPRHGPREFVGIEVAHVVSGLSSGSCFFSVAHEAPSEVCSR